MEGQKSAEAIVVREREGPNVRDRKQDGELWIESLRHKRTKVRPVAEGTDGIRARLRRVPRLALRPTGHRTRKGCGGWKPWSNAATCGWRIDGWWATRAQQAWMA